MGVINLATTAVQIVLPSKKSNDKGVSATPTYNPSAPTQILTLPTYRDHLTDIYNFRQISDSNDLIQSLFINDPDMSSAVSSFLTVADTEYIAYVRDVNGAIDRPGQLLLNAAIQNLCTRNDYSKGFMIRPSIYALAESLRYFILLRGSISAELVINKLLLPQELRIVDTKSLRWIEDVPGHPVPSQLDSSGKTTSLDIPSFFWASFRRDPTKMYTASPFVSAINTIPARQQVINDLYRIMNFTGYPRMDIKVIEEVLVQNLPADISSDPQKRANFIQAQINGITNQITKLSPDQAFVHTDAVEADMVNSKSPAASMDVGKVIDVLNAQNQAALKTMATILGRGTSGVNTASVEARVFSMSAQQINEPIAEMMSAALTLAIRMQGSTSQVFFAFRPVEMRSDTELEPMLIVRASRLKEDLSLGIIDDDEYHLQMYGRIRPDSAPILSGTGFLSSPTGVDTSSVSPNSDPLGRSLSTPGSKAAKSSTVNKPAK